MVSVDIKHHVYLVPCLLTLSNCWNLKQKTRSNSLRKPSSTSLLLISPYGLLNIHIWHLSGFNMMTRSVRACQLTWHKESSAIYRRSADQQKQQQNPSRGCWQLWPDCLPHPHPRCHRPKTINIHTINSKRQRSAALGLSSNINNNDNNSYAALYPVNIYELAAL